MENPEIALAVIVENGGGGSKVAAPIGRALFDYWVLQRKTNPIVPPSDEELAKIRAEKQQALRLKKEQEALAKAQKDNETNSSPQQTTKQP